MKDIIIILPEKISVLRDGVDGPLKRNIQEFNIYFKNIILPYREEYDIQVRCRYGKNFGSFWRLSEYPHDVDSFPFEIVIYNEYGERIASKKATIELYDRSEYDKPYNMIFVGDSMTFHRQYLNQIVNNLHSIVLKGSRNEFGNLAHEGRGGWAYKGYLYQYRDIYGVSPFLFPDGVDNYMGDIDFINNVNAEPHRDYDYTGYEKHTFVEGATYGKEGDLYTYQNGEFKLIKKNPVSEFEFKENPMWKFDFEKYVKRHNLGKIDAVSILMGANDLQLTTYEESEGKISEYINNTEFFINAIHKYDKNIKIMINLPIIGAEQYAWGARLGCEGSGKMYRYNMIHTSKAILDKWGNNEGDGIYIGPMLLCIDPENGFPKESTKANKHSDALETHHSNWVHPNNSGYCQMGDAVCGVIQKMRNS